MAKGDNQKLVKSSRKANKGEKDRRKGFNKSVKSVHEARREKLRKMVEALIENDSKAASNHLHEYLSSKSRDIILGEQDDDEEFELNGDDEEDVDDDEDEDEDDDEDDDDDEEDEDDEDDEDEEDEDEDDEEKEEVSEASYRDVTHKNRAKHLDYDVKGRNYGKKGKSKMSKYRHKNSARGLSGDVEGDALQDPRGTGKLGKYQHGNKAKHLTGDVEAEVDVADHQKGGRKNRTS